MKTLKKLVVIIMAAVMLCGAFSVTAFARGPVTATYCNDTVSAEDVRYALAERIAENANNTILYLVERAQASRHPNIAMLVRTTDMISANAISLIRMLGFDAECVYETYVIGGVEVEIDPIIIIKRTIGG